MTRRRRRGSNRAPARSRPALQNRCASDRQTSSAAGLARRGRGRQRSALPWPAASRQVVLVRPSAATMLSTGQSRWQWTSRGPCPGRRTGWAGVCCRRVRGRGQRGGCRCSRSAGSRGPRGLHDPIEGGHDAALRSSSSDLSWRISRAKATNARPAGGEQLDRLVVLERMCSAQASAVSHQSSVSGSSP